MFAVLKLGGSGEVERDQAARIHAVKEWFRTHRDWLLIVDNVDDEQTAAVLAGSFGDLTTGHVLITSRLQNWGDNVEPLNIEVLSPDASADLLLQLTDKKRRKASDDATQVCEVAKLMEGLPLALHQAAGYINEQRLTFAAYLVIYEKEAAEPLGWFKGNIIHYERLDKDTPKPVLITWKTSFDKLEADTRFWLLVFAHYAPDPIPEFLLDSAPNATDEVKALHCRARAALAQAESYSLLTRTDDPPRFKLHRLVQHILRLSASQDENTSAIATVMQRTTLLFELEAPVLFCVRKLRPIAFVIGIGLHLMIALMMKELIFFSAQMWTFYALFVTPEQWRWLGGKGEAVWRWLHVRRAAAARPG